MRCSARWHDGGKVAFFLTLFAVCCVLAWVVRALIAEDALSDLAVVLLDLTTLIAFAGLATLTLWVGWRTERRAVRIVLRILPVVVALVGATLAKSTYATTSIALQALTEKLDGAATSLVIGPSGRDVRLSGDLTEGAATRLAALLDTHPKIERVQLTSEGGLSDEGEALRKVILARRLTTYVPDYCLSACTLAFLGGRERLIRDEAELGFHAPYEEGLFGQTFPADNAEERAHYLAAGVTPDFIDEAFKVAPDEVWTPKVDRLLAAHIATGVVDRARFLDAGAERRAIVH